MEIKNDQMDKGIWGKAFADSDGDKHKAEAKYIKYRAAELFQIEEKEKLKTIKEDKAEQRIIGIILILAIVILLVILITIK